MIVRASWSPTRLKAALQCGRRIQGLEEGWPRTEHIRGIRGGVVHQVIQAWEESGRALDLAAAVSQAWATMLERRSVESSVVDLWLEAVEAFRAVEEKEQAVAESLAGDYRNPRATKAFKAAVAEFADERVEAERLANKARVAAEGLVWPFEHGGDPISEGFDHALETVRRGTVYLTELWPEPDLIGSEWHLSAKLGGGYEIHGYVDRVELCADGVVEVVDYKSSKYEETPLDHWLQSATYAFLVGNHMGVWPGRVRLVYLRNQTSDVFAVGESWPEKLLALVEAADARLGSKSFAPTFAGCGICPFYEQVCALEFGMSALAEEPSAP